MIDFVSRTLNIRKNEWPRFLLLALMFFLFFVGNNWGETTVLAQLYVQNVSLSAAFMANAIISIVFTSIYTTLIDRISNKFILIGILGVSFVSVVSGLALLLAGQIEPAYLALYVLARVIRSAFLLHWWTYVNGFYDTRAAKRIVPVLSIAARFAVIFSGISLAILNSLAVTKQSIVIMWAGTLTIVAVLAWLMPLLLGEDKSSDDTIASGYLPGGKTASGGEKRASFIDNVREGYRYVSKSPFLRWMAASTFVLVIVYSLLNPLGGDMLSQALPDDEVTSYIAILGAVTNAVMLPVMLLFSRIVGRIGLGNASLIYPIGTVIICALFVGVGLPVALDAGEAIPGILIIFSASLTFFDRDAFRYGLREPANNLLYNAVPLRVKGRTRAFINGLVLPVSLLAGGIILRLPFLEASFLYVLLGVMAVLYLVTAFVIRRFYAQALVDMLEHEDFSFMLAPASDLMVADAATIDYLTTRLEEATNTDIKIFMAQFLCELAGAEALPTLERLAREGDSYIRASILNIITAADLRGDAVRDLYIEFLHDPDPRVRQQAVAGLEEWAGDDNEQFLSLAVELLQDENLDVRARVLPSLVGSGDLFYLATSIQTLNELLNDDDPYRRTVGIRVVGKAGDVRFIRNLIDYLKDPADQARLEAALAIEQLATQATMPKGVVSAVMAHMAPLLEEDLVERIRLATLRVLGQIDTPEAHTRLTGAFDDVSDEVRKEAVDILVRYGEAIKPVVEPLLTHREPVVGKMAAVTIARIDPEAGRMYIDAFIDANLETIYHNYARLDALTDCLDYPSIKVLYDTLAEQNETLAEEIFYLLSADHPAADVEIIAESLRSDTPRVRANAAEALEALANPQVARLTAPLFDPESTPAQLLDLSAELIGRRPGTASVLREMLTDEDAWLRVVSTFALGDIMSFSPGAEEPVVEESPRVRTAATLLDELADTAREGVPDTRVLRGLAGDKSGREESSVGSLRISSLMREASSKDSEETAAPRPAEPRMMVFFTQAPDAEPTGQASEEPAPLEEMGVAEGLLAVLDEAPQGEQPVMSDDMERVSRQGRVVAGQLDTGLLVEQATEDETAFDFVKAAGAFEVVGDQPCRELFTLHEIHMFLERARSDPNGQVQVAAISASRMIAGMHLTQAGLQEMVMLSTIEKVILLKKVPFFQGMKIDYLKVLASICEEELFVEDQEIFHQGDPGGALYVVVRGRVGIEREGKRKGSTVRVATIGTNDSFGEITLFDGSPRNASVIALQDTLTLKIRREPIIELARQHPELSLQLINVLSQQLREANDRIAELAPSRPRELHRVFDRLG